MQSIRCTSKLLTEMGLNAQTSSSCDAGTYSILGSWYADLIFIDRRKCLLFVNEKTLFNFMIPDVPRRQIRELDKLFLGFLQCILTDEGIDHGIKNSVQAEYRTLEYIALADETMLATVDDLAARYKSQVKAEGGVYHCNLAEIIHKMNSLPLSALGYSSSVDELKKIYCAEAETI
ncbi:MAG: DUF6933 domain-containing protein [Gammaproteobacteria bacterium]